MPSDAQQKSGLEFFQEAARCPASVTRVQAKTTKKVVLRLTCNKCKAVHMHAIKVRCWCSPWPACGVVCRRVSRLHGTCLIMVATRRQVDSARRSLALYDWRLSDRFLPRMQRCKHFEIGGDKKQKGQAY